MGVVPYRSHWSPESGPATGLAALVKACTVVTVPFGAILKTGTVPAQRAGGVCSAVAGRAVEVAVRRLEQRGGWRPSVIPGESMQDGGGAGERDLEQRSSCIESKRPVVAP